MRTPSSNSTMYTELGAGAGVGFTWLRPPAPWGQPVYYPCPVRLFHWPQSSSSPWPSPLLRPSSPATDLAHFPLAQSLQATSSYMWPSPPTPPDQVPAPTDRSLPPWAIPLHPYWSSHPPRPSLPCRSPWLRLSAPLVQSPAPGIIRLLQA